MKIIKPQQNLSKEKLNDMLKKDSVAQIVLSKKHPLNQGDLVGVRLNLNLIKIIPGQVILTIHKGNDNVNYKNNRSFFKSEAIDYAEATWISEAYFNVNQLAREQIASNKLINFPMASIDGTFKDKNIPENYSGIEINFNPKFGHWFTDENGFAIHYAEEVVVLGNRAYASGEIKYYTESLAPKKIGNTPSSTKFKTANESSMLIEKTFVNYKLIN